MSASNPPNQNTEGELTINGPRVVGTTPGRPFLFRIPRSSYIPITFQAEDLPSGLTLDEESGIISGSLNSSGIFPVPITVSNSEESITRILNIVGGEHKLSLTPPMGWNAWNAWGSTISDKIIRETADCMINSGLADHGYEFVNIDDGWEGTRCEKDHIRPNEKFPDMKALADYIHSQGLKFGIYSSPGIKTCAGYEGSLGHEEDDAITFAKWGIDLLKYDWCSYQANFPRQYRSLNSNHKHDLNYINNFREELKKPYQLMRKALDNIDRDIIYSLSPKRLTGVLNSSDWGIEVGANLWRTTSDINEHWSSMSRIGFGQNNLGKNAGPGHWNDPDMLVVGRVSWGKKMHPTKLSPNAQITHITLWSMLAAPLLIGCDLSALDDFTTKILTNDEILAIDQDPLGIQAIRKQKQGPLEIWTRPLWDDTIAVAGFNRSNKLKTISIRWQDIGINDTVFLRDLWSHQDLGESDPIFEMQLPAQGACLLKIGEPQYTDLNLAENAKVLQRINFA